MGIPIYDTIVNGLSKAADKIWMDKDKKEQLKFDRDQFVGEVKLAVKITHEYARENDVPVWICRSPKITLQELWPRLERYRF